ncbi:MAG: hypothetical protein AB8D52_04785 [Gammaproteobacteria bacterium]
MLKISNRNQLFLGLFFVLLMAVSRGHHFESLQSLPSASLAIFFLAGIYIKKSWFFSLLLAEAALIDYVVITFGGVSSFCVTPAYAMLILAYGAMWMGGAWYSNRHENRWTTFVPLVLSIVAAVFISEVISSGSFYFLSERFTDTNMTEMMARLIKYSPNALANTAFYVGCAALIHVTLVAIKSVSNEENSDSIS